MSDFFQILMGNFTTSELIIWILVQFIWFLVFLFIAYYTHTKVSGNPYSIMKHTMSFLGSAIPERNPRGWWTFSIGLGGLGISFFPMLTYYHSKMAQISGWAAWIGSILQFLGMIGIVLVACIPDNEGNDFFKDLKYGQIHNVVAGIGFGGLGFGNLWYGIMFFFDAISESPIYNSAVFLPPFIILAGIITFIAITQAKWEKICRADSTKESFPGEGIYSFPLWEWIVIFYMIISIYYVLIMLSVTFPF